MSTRGPLDVSGVGVTDRMIGSVAGGADGAAGRGASLVVECDGTGNPLVTAGMGAHRTLGGSSNYRNTIGGSSTGAEGLPARAEARGHVVWIGAGSSRTGATSDNGSDNSAVEDES